MSGARPDLSKLDSRMTAKLLSRMHEPLTRPSATLSPLRGARGSRHSHRECPSPRLRGEGAAKRRMRGSRCANLDSTGALPPAGTCNRGDRASARGRDASYSDALFLELHAGRFARFGAIELDSFAKRHTQRFQKLFASALLAVHAGKLFDPADPPAVGLFEDR